ncbi:protein translation factor SUI1-like protein [Senna tora]|uniref:Protein translation factor SUI1-like protein n=1 Tax=Senna tora TaxID=362788 RepID=A0A834TKT4_9FABA|nr:protein translation factor SUI1-like protein [Senna tora]
MFPGSLGFLNRRNSSDSRDESCIIPFIINTGDVKNVERGKEDQGRDKIERRENEVAESTGSSSKLNKANSPTPTGFNKSRTTASSFSDSSSTDRNATASDGSSLSPRDKSSEVSGSSSGTHQSRDHLSQPRDLVLSTSGVQHELSGVSPVMDQQNTHTEAQHEVQHGGTHQMVTRAKAGIHKPKYPFVEVHRDESGFHLSQAKYVLDVLKKFNLLTCSPAPTPMVTGKPFVALEGAPMKNPSTYRQAISSLQYLVTTRPDIAFSVNKLSQYLSSPTELHFQGSLYIVSISYKQDGILLSLGSKLICVDPFAEANAEDSGAGTKDYVHIRIQQRNGRKSLTTVQGLKKEFSYNKILKDLKKEFCCNGTVVEDPELGQVIQLQGDQRKNVSTFLVQVTIAFRVNAVLCANLILSVSLGSSFLLCCSIFRVLLSLSVLSMAGILKKEHIKIHGF